MALYSPFQGHIRPLRGLLCKSVSCSFIIDTSCFEPVSIVIDIGILKSSEIIDILDVLCFFICGLLETKSSPNLLHTNVVSMS